MELTSGFATVPPMQIRNTVFDKFAAVEIRTAKARMVIVTEIGPRVAHLSAI
jgi:hypothetical protein